MITVRPSGTMTFVVTSVTSLLGSVKPPTSVTVPVEDSGWTSMRIMPSLEMNGRSRNCVPVSRKATAWVVLVRFCDVELT